VALLLFHLVESGELRLLVWLSPIDSFGTKIVSERPLYLRIEWF
jgi:hypothetical protein